MQAVPLDACVPVVARIQAHPSRAHLRPVLIEDLGLPTEVIEHASNLPNPWAGYKKCLSDIPSYAKHLLVIQDDAHVCHNFAPAIEQIALSNPDTPVVLFLARLPRRIANMALHATKKRQVYLDCQLRSNDFLPVVAILWPVEKAQEFLVWTQANPHKLGHKDPRSDDAVGGRWASLTKQTVRFTIPSLVQHPDQVPSLIGRRASWGKDSGRVAQYFCEGDPLDFSW